MDQKLKEAILQCEEHSRNIGDIAFLFDTNKSYRDDSENEYFVSSIKFLYEFPSRRSIYDTQFKELDSTEKFKKAYRIIEKLGFTASENNLGEKYEQIFTKKIIINDSESLLLNLRLLPNMTVKIDKFTSEGPITKYQGFFDYKRVFMVINEIDKDFTSFIRDIIIEEILN